MRTRIQLIYVSCLIIVTLGCSREAGHFPANDARNDIQRIRLNVFSIAETTGKAPLQADVNAWLSGQRVEANTTVFAASVASLGPAPLDPWGHPYVFLYRDPISRELGDYAVYSCGPNGTSATDGNDPDDVRSW
jgi:hypothetical protein